MVARRDPHSVHDDEQPQVTALAWRVRLDPAARILSGEARLTLATDGGGALDLDTRDLKIQAVRADDGTPLPFSLGPIDPIVGSALRIELPPGARALTVRYRTLPEARGLAWLESDGAPFVFTQAQPIHARSFVPLPDSPSLRLRWSADVTAPDGLTVLTSAVAEPVPPYLIAFAAGRLVARELSPRTRVWATASLADEAARVLAYVPRLLDEAEALLGPYAWGRFDLLVMPPETPFGGMENPGLAFLSPTLLTARDGGLPVLAHELSHAWLGNLVTCASAEHFWLNEGFAVWAERRLIASLLGPEVAACESALGRRALEHTLSDLADGPLTRLHTALGGIAPEEGLSRVAYEKGALLLSALEHEVGRPRFEAFVRAWIATHRQRAVTSADFLSFARANFGPALDAIDAERWIEAPGLPNTAPPPPSLMMDPPPPTAATACWRQYLESLGPLRADQCAELDRLHSLSTTPDLDLRAAFLARAIEAGHAESIPHAESLCALTGRTTILLPLYRALSKSPQTRPTVGNLYQRNRARYLFPTQRVLEAMLRHAGVATSTANPLSLSQKGGPAGGTKSTPR